MAHFYGVVRGSAKSPATRTGSKKTSLETIAASWDGAIKVLAWYNEEEDEDWVMISFIRWEGAGTDMMLYEGPISEYSPISENPGNEGDDYYEDNNDY